MLLLPVLAVLVTGLAVEGALRLAGAYVPLGYYLPQPGALRDTQSDYDVTYHVDGRGMREMPERPPLPPGTAPVRVVLVGDSFTFGQGVEAADAMPAQLESRLRAAGVPAEVISLSAIGAGIAEYRVLLRDGALPLHPALVVVNVFGNDASSAQASTGTQRLQRAAAHASHVVTLLRTANRTRLLRENVRLSHDPAAFWARLEETCARHSGRETCAERVRRFRALAGSRTNNLAAACLTDPDEVRRWVETDGGGAGWAEFREGVRDMHRRCAAAGIPLVLGVIPDAAQVDPGHLALLRDLGVSFRTDPLQGPGPFQTLVEGLGRELGIPVYSPLPAFRAAGPGTYFPEDLHWSPAGNRLYTDGLAPAVLAALGRP